MLTNWKLFQLIQAKSQVDKFNAYTLKLILIDLIR